MFQVRLSNAGPPDIYLILKITVVDESFFFILATADGGFWFVFVCVNAASLGSLGCGGVWEGGTQTCPQPAGLGSALPVSIQMPRQKDVDKCGITS